MSIILNHHGNLIYTTAHSLPSSTTISNDISIFTESVLSLFTKAMQQNAISIFTTESAYKYSQFL